MSGMHKSPRCTATSKRTRQRCQGPAVTGWTVCRFHGAGGGAPKGPRNGNYRHGLHTAEAVAERRLVAAVIHPRDVARIACQPMPPELAGHIAAMMGRTDRSEACAAALCNLNLADGKAPAPADFTLLDDHDGR